MSFTNCFVSLRRWKRMLPTSEFSSCPLGQTLQTARGQTVSVAKRRITRTFVRLDSEIQSSSRRGTRRAHERNRFLATPSPTSMTRSTTAQRFLHCLVTRSSRYVSGSTSRVPTRIQHFHVRLWHIILMHQGETSIFVVEKKPPNSWS